MPKSIELAPDWRHWFWNYAAGILLVPLFGIGIYILWRLTQKKRAIRYLITNEQIKASGPEFTQTIDLVNISDIKVRQRWIDQKFEIGTIKIDTGSRTINIIGQTAPHKLAKMIEQAVEGEKKRLAELAKVKPKEEEKAPPGTLDRLDYLTGLWQQGLLSDEDFKKEKKHFES